MSVRTGAVWLSPRHRPNRSWWTGTSGPRGARWSGPSRFCTRSGVGVRHADPGDMAGEAPVFQHPGDVEVFDHDGAVLADEPGGQLVQAVAAGGRREGGPGAAAGP